MLLLTARCKIDYFLYVRVCYLYGTFCLQAGSFYKLERFQAGVGGGTCGKGNLLVTQSTVVPG